MTLWKEYPELGQFFGYFNQDLDLEIPEGGDWRDVVDFFLNEEPPIAVEGTITELDRLLAAYPTDKDIRRSLIILGNNYLPSIGTREWVVALRSRLAAASDRGGWESHELLGGQHTGPQLVTATPTEQQYPHLWTLFGAYFHQDVYLDIPKGGDWRDVVDAFTAGEDTPGAVADLDRLLATGASDQELERTTDALGNTYTPETGMREWLSAIRARLITSEPKANG